MTLMDLFNWNVLSSGKRAMEKGFVIQPGFKGDIFQLGGVFYFYDDKLLYSFIEKYAGDLPRFDEVIGLIL